MCDRCENSGVLAGLMARAGVISLPEVSMKDGGDDAHPLETDPGGNKGATMQRRPRLWELEEKHHCPVIGTCLALEELKKIARRGFAGKGFEPYRLHVEAVSISCSRNDTSEAMHKLLERKFSLDVARFNRLRGDADVLSLWKLHLERGEVAGPMWAALTHKAASKETRNTVYSDVHMLSHQVGAGQAADLRRLDSLQMEHAVLQAAHAALKESEAEVACVNQGLNRELRDLRGELQVRSEEAQSLRQRLDVLESGEAMVAMGRRLVLAESQAARATELEVRLKVLEQKVGQLRAEKVRLARELEEATAERDALERLWGERTSPRMCPAPAPASSATGDSRAAACSAWAAAPLCCPSIASWLSAWGFA